MLGPGAGGGVSPWRTGFGAQRQPWPGRDDIRLTSGPAAVCLRVPLVRSCMCRVSPCLPFSPGPLAMVAGCALRSQYGAACCCHRPSEMEKQTAGARPTSFQRFLLPRVCAQRFVRRFFPVWRFRDPGKFWQLGWLVLTSHLVRLWWSRNTHAVVVFGQPGSGFGRSILWCAAEMC